jgi:hypothetical protein
MAQDLGELSLSQEGSKDKKFNSMETELGKRSS